MPVSMNERPLGFIVSKSKSIQLFISDHQRECRVCAARIETGDSFGNGIFNVPMNFYQSEFEQVEELTAPVCHTCVVLLASEGW